MSENKLPSAQRREWLYYAIFGVLTTVVNVFIFMMMRLNQLLSVEVATVAAWFVAVWFAFETNRRWVFANSLEKKNRNAQWWRFMSSRLTTGALDVLVMYVGTSWLQFHEGWLKIASNRMVIVLNYFLSKWWVFPSDWD